MPLVAPLTPRKMLPPPMTMTIWTPSLCTSTISSAMSERVSASMPFRDPPMSASPESLRRIRLYLGPAIEAEFIPRGVRGIRSDAADSAWRSGYTFGMKTAVSIPDDVFEKVERLARRARKSRSEVFSAALREYVARHAPEEVTEAMDRVCAAVNDQPDAFVSAAARRVMKRTEW